MHRFVLAAARGAILLLLGVAFAGAPSGGAGAAEIPAQSVIDTVTVFPRGAEVTRLTDVSVPAGEHVIVLRDLPPQVVAESLRVTGQADAALAIGSVDSRISYVPESEAGGLSGNERKLLEDELERLRDERAAIDDEIASANTQKRLVEGLADLPRTGVGASTDVRPRTTEEWNEIIGLIGSRLADINRQIQDRQIAARAVGRRIEDIERQLADTTVPQRQRMEVRINVAADAELSASLSVRYQVYQASWEPHYDVRLSANSTETPPALEIIRLASISQTSGERWENIGLSLSTTQPQRGTAAPELQPLTVDFEPERRLRKARSVGGVFNQDSAADAEAVRAPAVASIAAEEAPQPAAPVEAQVVDAPFQAIYVIPGRHTILPEDGAKRVQIDQHSVQPQLNIRTVPRANAAAYLYAQLEVPNGLRLLPGRTSLFRDGVFVGYGGMPLLSGGEKHDLGFGVDDAIRVKYDTLKSERGESGLISTSTTDVRQFKVSVKNLHDWPVEVRVLDQIPVSENEEIVVTYLSSASRPDESNLEGKRGVIAWDLDLKAQQEREITFGYQLAWPKDKRIQFSGAPGIPLPR